MRLARFSIFLWLMLSLFSGAVGAAEALSDYQARNASGSLIADPYMWVNPKSTAWSNRVTSQSIQPVPADKLSIDSASDPVKFGRFLSGGSLGFSKSNFLDNVTTARTVIMLYKTGGDISTPQILYEEGGSLSNTIRTSGLNLYIRTQGQQNQLSGCMWTNQELTAHLVDAHVLQSDTAYISALVYSGNPKAFTLYNVELDELFDRYTSNNLIAPNATKFSAAAANIGAEFPAHGDGDAIGNINPTSFSSDGTASTKFCNGNAATSATRVFRASGTDQSLVDYNADYPFKGGLATALVYMQSVNETNLVSFMKALAKNNLFIFNWKGVNGASSSGQVPTGEASNNNYWDTGVTPSASSLVLFNISNKKASWDISGSVQSVRLGPDFTNSTVTLANDMSVSKKLFLEGGTLDVGLHKATASNAKITYAGGLSVSLSHAGSVASGSIAAPITIDNTNGGGDKATLTLKWAGGTPQLNDVYTLLNTSSITSTTGGFNIVIDPGFATALDNAGLTVDYSTLYSAGTIKLVYIPPLQRAKTVTLQENDQNSKGIYCLDESFVLSVLNSTSNPVSDYNGIIALDTTTGKGIWYKNGVALGGNNGKGTYQFTGSEGGTINLTLRYRYEPNITASFSPGAAAGARDIRDESNVANTTRSVTASQITFYSKGLVLSTNQFDTSATPATLPTFFNPQTGGKAFDLYVTAYGGLSKTDPNLCGPITSYSGNATLTWSHLNPENSTTNPAFGSGTVNGNQLTLSLSSGRVSTTVSYGDVGKINFTVSAAGLVGDTQDFVVKPAKLTITATSIDGVASPAIATPPENTPAFVGAGEAFKVTVQAFILGPIKNGVPSFRGANSFGQETLLSTEKLTLSAALKDPSNGVAGIFAASLVPPATAATDNFSCSQASCTNQYTYSEVGNIDLVASMDYLSSGIIESATQSVGRFIPDHYDVVQTSYPVTKDNVVTAACGFSYQGTEITPVSPGLGMTVTAKNKQGITLQNYNATYSKLSATMDTIWSERLTYQGGNSQIADRTSAFASKAFFKLTSVGNNIATPSDGVVTYAAPEGTISYGRANSLYDGTGISSYLSQYGVQVLVKDSDGACYRENGVCAPFVFKSAALNGSTIFNGGANFLYGRMVVKNASGSELRQLKIPVEAQYWNGTGFVTNEADSCSTFLGSTIVVSDVANKGNLWSGNKLTITPSTANSLALNRGKGDIILSAPLSAGQVKVALDVPSYLEYAFHDILVSGARQLENPQGLATFGTYRGRPPIIFMQQIYGR